MLGGTCNIDFYVRYFANSDQRTLIKSFALIRKWTLEVLKHLATFLKFHYVFRPFLVVALTGIEDKLLLLPATNGDEGGLETKAMLSSIAKCKNLLTDISSRKTTG